MAQLLRSFISRSILASPRKEINMMTHINFMRCSVMAFVVLFLYITKPGIAEEMHPKCLKYLELTKGKVFDCPSDETLKYFSEQSENMDISQIYINDGSRITDTGIAYLVKLPLVVLSIRKGNFEGKNFNQFTLLCYLHLTDCSLSDKAINSIVQMPSLVSLDIYNVSGITTTGFAVLLNSNKVRELTVYTPLITNSWFIHQDLEKITRLESLTLCGNLHESIFEAIACIPNLKSLNISCITDRQDLMSDEKKECARISILPVWHWNTIANHLGKLQHLKTLELSCIGGIITDPENITIPVNFAHLKSLKIGGIIDYEFTEAIYEKIPELDSLDILHTPAQLQKFLSRNPAIDFGEMYSRDPDLERANISFKQMSEDVNQILTEENDNINDH